MIKIIDVRLKFKRTVGNVARFALFNCRRKSKAKKNQRNSFVSSCFYRFHWDSPSWTTENKRKQEEKLRRSQSFRRIFVRDENQDEWNVRVRSVRDRTMQNVVLLLSVRVSLIFFSTDVREGNATIYFINQYLLATEQDEQHWKERSRQKRKAEHSEEEMFPPSNMSEDKTRKESKKQKSFDPKIDEENERNNENHLHTLFIDRWRGDKRHLKIFFFVSMRRMSILVVKTKCTNKRAKVIKSTNKYLHLIYEQFLTINWK